MSGRHVDRVTRAVKRLCSDHGVPNRFACMEIASEAGLTNLRVGQLLASSIDEIEKGVASALERPVMLAREADEKDYTWLDISEPAIAAKGE